MSNESDKNSPSIERIIQLLAGIAIMFYRWYVDGQSNIDFTNLTLVESFWIGYPYLFAAILIKGMTFKQLLELLNASGDLIRAWRGK